MARAKIPIFLMGVLLLWCCLTTSTKADEYMKYKDPKQPVSNRIQDLLKRMTLEEKIGQMVQIDREIASAEVMNKYFIGEHHPSLSDQRKYFVPNVAIVNSKHFIWFGIQEVY